jgi:hypothetical protein
MNAMKMLKVQIRSLIWVLPISLVVALVGFFYVASHEAITLPDELKPIVACTCFYSYASGRLTTPTSIVDSSWCEAAAKTNPGRILYYNQFSGEPRCDGALAIAILIYVGGIVFIMLSIFAIYRQTLVSYF